MTKKLQCVDRGGEVFHVTPEELDELRGLEAMLEKQTGTEKEQLLGIVRVAEIRGWDKPGSVEETRQLLRELEETGA